jgi:hypothetical protein
VGSRAQKIVKARDLFRRDLRKARARENRSQNKMASQVEKANRKVSQKASMVGNKTMATIPKRHRWQSNRFVPQVRKARAFCP